jgi:ABC-2 type transport system permease protein
MQYLTQLEYRGVLNFQFAAKIFGFGSGYVVIALMFYSFQNINGWSVYEVIFLRALFDVVYSLSSCLFHNAVEQMPQKIASGEFDAILTRPVNSLFYYMFRVFSTGYISNFLIGVSMLVFAWVNIGIGLDPVKIGFLLLVIFGGVLIQSSMYIAATVPNFWFIKGDAISSLVLYGASSFIEYPLSIFKLPVQIALTFILPYAFINFYPAQYFLSKNDFLFFPAIQFLTPLVGLVFFFGAYKLWIIGTNHYQSTGS